MKQPVDGAPEEIERDGFTEDNVDCLRLRSCGFD
jgi:hypothetical protein